MTLSKSVSLKLFASLIAFSDLVLLAKVPLAHALSFVPIVVFLLVPGYMFLQLFRIKHLDPWAKAAFAVSFGLALLMFGGLALNEVLPLFGAQHPLTQAPILIFMNFISLLLLGTGYFGESINFSIVLPSWRRALFALLILALPLSAAAGAIRLNNGASNSVSIFVILLVAAIACFVTIKKQLSNWYFPLFIYILSISLLLIWSVRSLHLSGGDIGLEHYVYDRTLNSGRWSISSFRDPYNACLSITILPTMFSNLSHYGTETIYKIIYPLIFGIVPTVIFSLFKNYGKIKTAFLATFFFITQSIFIFWMPMLARQEIALIFFSIALLLIFGLKEVPLKTKKILLFIEMSALIVSHYSTAYIALIVIMIGFILLAVLRRAVGPKFRDLLKTSLPTAGFILFLIVFTFFWQSQVTDTTHNLSLAVKNTISGLVSQDGPEDRNPSANKVFSLNPFSGAQDPNQQVAQFKAQLAADIGTNADYYNNAAFYENDIQPAFTPDVPQWSAVASVAISLLDAALSLAVRLALVLGLVWMLITYKKQNAQYIAFSAGFLAVMMALVLFPYISTAYNIERLYQNALMLLAVPIIYGIYIIGKPIRRFISPQNFALVIVVGFFFYNAGLLSQISGGQPSAILNNYGGDYDQNYTHSTEVSAIGWLGQNRLNDEPVYADKSSERVLASYGGITEVNRNMLPVAIEKKSYVYLSYANTKENITSMLFNGQDFSMTPPKAFLNADKNTVYTNGDTEIFH